MANAMLMRCTAFVSRRSGQGRLGLLTPGGGTTPLRGFSSPAMVSPMAAPHDSSMPVTTKASRNQEPVIEVDYKDIMDMTPTALSNLRKAFMGPKAFGVVVVKGIPEYGKLREEAFRAGINLALVDKEGRTKAAAVNNTYPGWSGTPGKETHPLQNSFLFNSKEELNEGPDPYFGKNIFPTEEYRKTWMNLARPMHDSALQVLRCCDVLMEEVSAKEGLEWGADGRSLTRLADKGPVVASRFICYDSGFTREDNMLREKETAERNGFGSESLMAANEVVVDSSAESMPSLDIQFTNGLVAGHSGDDLASMRTHSTPVKSAGHAGDDLASMRTHSTPVKSAGHAGDDLASMRTHSTPVKSAGHAGDDLASMRTHSTPVKSAGHAGDDLASMRTHSTPVKSAGHAGDDLASMRTHSTPVKSAGHAGDDLASMRTHSTPVKSAGHAGDDLASMRTHSTPVKSAGHAGDDLASMRTHSTPVRSAGHAGDDLASMRTHSTPVKSAGHAGDDLASMRTHSTPVRSAGHAGDDLASMRTHSTPVKSAGHAGDDLASMRTHSTPVRSAGHAGDDLASMRTHSTPVKSAGHAGDDLASMRTHSTPVKSAGHAGDDLASMRTHATPVKSSGFAKETVTSAFGRAAFETNTDSPMMSSRMHSTQLAQASSQLDFSAALSVEPVVPATPEPVEATQSEFGEYWLPWHIDSNYLTLIHKDMYVKESDSTKVPHPEGAGVMLMNSVGDTALLDNMEDEGVLIIQWGAFGQIYSGGHMVSGRHAVKSTMPPGVARFNFCNFWYAPWDTECIPPAGREHKAISKGWNSMMDDSYLNITMKQGFAAFRKFMTSPEARVQFADSIHFTQLAARLLPSQSAAVAAPIIPAKNSVADVESVQTATASIHHNKEVVVDVLTDIRCPISYLATTKLSKALQNLGMENLVRFRYVPIFLNPNVPKGGESLDDYLFREFGYTKEYAHSKDYWLYKAGLDLGVNLNPDRRVVNTFDAFCVLEVAQEHGLQSQMFEELSHRYFEDAEDISDQAVLMSAASAVGLPTAAEAMNDPAVRMRVQSKYEEFSSSIQEVPHFVLRDSFSGNGLDTSGNRSVEQWEGVLQKVISKGARLGKQVPGPYGEEVMLKNANPTSPITMAFDAQHQWSAGAWPYTAKDFSRLDETDDSIMYEAPRFVNHLDDSSLESLTNVYRSFFGAVQPGFAVLDLCSSWTSHFPPEKMHGARVVAAGLNLLEVGANKQATEHHVQDLNKSQTLQWEDQSFDFVTNTLSVQYLTQPKEVFAEVHRVLKPGGVAIIAFSHRTFINKCVNVWARETYDGEGHAHILRNYLLHSAPGGWSNLSSVDVSPQNGDPMWIVTAVKAPEF